MTAAHERGSATVHVAMFVSVLTLVTVVCTCVAALIVGHRQANAAADLAALAGAAALGRGEAACEAAGEIASRNGAQMVACRPGGATVTVTVARHVHVLHGRVRITGRARAGPVIASGPA